MQRTSLGGMTALITAAALALVGQRAALAEQGTTSEDAPRSEGQCGELWGDRSPPATRARADIDGDGVEEHFIATAQGVEQLRTQEGSSPPTLVRDRTIYRSSVGVLYSCAELVFADLDGDRDLDMVFASPRELVVFENRHGQLVVTRREPLDFELTRRVTIVIQGQNVSAR